MSEQPTVPSPSARIKALNAQLQVWRNAYYVLAKPLVTDEEYDLKERELKQLAEANPNLRVLATVLDAVGSDLPAAAMTQPIKHRSPMLSLENAYNDEDLDKWLEKLPPEATFDLEPKVDGLSLSVRYANHTLWLAVTRGDGGAGEDATAAALAITDIPKQLNPGVFPHDLEVRGEVFLTRQQFAEINRRVELEGKEPYRTSRNLASGTLKLKDPKEIAKRGLSFQAWQVMGMEPAAGTWVPDTPEHMAQCGYKIPPGLEPAQALEYFAKCTITRQCQVIRARSREELRPALELARTLRETLWADIIGDTDGVVIKVHEHYIREALGAGTSTVKWAIARKWPSERVSTTLNSVTWQVGRTGRLTPVAEVEPVGVSGVTVSRATLNNVTYMRTKIPGGPVHVGDRVELHRGGEVIPNITSVLAHGETRTAIEVPGVCPSCGESLTTEVSKPDKDNPEGVTQLYCTNAYCHGRLTEHLAYLGSRACLDIEGLGDVLAEQLVREGIVFNLGALWEWANEMHAFLEAHGEDALRTAAEAAGYPFAQILSLIKGCMKAKTAGWDSWLMALGVPSIAKELGKSLAAFLALESEGMLTLHERLQEVAPKQVEGLGPERLKEIGRWAQDPRTHQNLIQLYNAGVRPTCTVVIKEGPQPLAGEVILVTGELGPEREHLKRQLESLGAQTKTSVSKKLTLIIAGTGAGGSKLSKAAELGIRVEGREWLVQVFKSAGLELEDNTMSDVPDAFDNL